MGTYAIITDKMLQIGDQFDQFQIQAHMAQGGMSDIYRAFDMVRRCEVVIKIPDQSMIGDPAQYERFQRELEVLDLLYWKKHHRWAAQQCYFAIACLHHLLRALSYSVVAMRKRQESGEAGFKVNRSVQCLKWMLSRETLRSVIRGTV